MYIRILYGLPLKDAMEKVEKDSPLSECIGVAGEADGAKNVAVQSLFYSSRPTVPPQRRPKLEFDFDK